MTAVALLVLAWLAFESATQRNAEIRDTVERSLAADLEAHATRFERGLTAELDGILRSATSSDVNLVSLQAELRRRHGWFDSVYVWRRNTPDASDALGLTSGPRVAFRFPRAPDLGTPRGPAHPCIAQARTRLLDDGGQGDPRRVAEVYAEACRDAPLTARVYASTEGATALKNGELHAQALRALAVDGLDDRAPLLAHVDAGITIQSRIARRLLASEILRSLGRTEEGHELLERTAYEVTGLDAPSLDLSLYLVDAAIATLEPTGRDVSMLRNRLARAEQRVAALRKIERLETRSLGSGTSSTASTRTVYDPSGPERLLMYFRPASERLDGVAVLIRHDRLVQDFLREDAQLFGREAVVTDVAGRVVAGGDGVLARSTSVPFPDLLSHLRVGLTTDAVYARVVPLQDSALTLRNMVTIFCIVLGFGALWAFAWAEQQHRMLLRRQREFTTRVTHELKTPLAGIKVMAEMLSFGAFRDADQRMQMADRIVDEADRLTARVDEILKVAKRQALPKPELVDLEEIALDLIDEWGPRYEQRKVRLHAEMEPVDPVMGHYGALRDAVSCLLDNALKYRRDDIDSEVWVTLRQDTRHAEVEVLDNGLGVPRGDRKAIFERFVRVEGDHRGKSGGHGLGLAQVAEIMARHKGTARCEEGVDGGSRFILRLPLANP